MNLNKSYEFFQPEQVEKDQIHIIGCGAIGSHVAESLTRLGIKELHLWDFDIVTEHNIANQMFFSTDIGMEKTEALASTCHHINPEAKPVEHRSGWTNEILSGYIFLCVDSIELRKKIVQTIMPNMVNIKAIFDFRMRLTDAQHYACSGNAQAIKTLLKTMNFTDAEAKENTPVSACNTTLSVNPTVKAIVVMGVANFLNFVREGKLKKFIQLDPFACILDAYDE